MPEGAGRGFGRASRIRDVLALGEAGRRALFEHGFDSGQGFVDVLSQWQSLEEAARSGRLRKLDSLLERLNQPGASRLSP